MEFDVKTEVAVGVFVLLGLLGIGYLSVSIGGIDLFPANTITLQARFASIGALKPGASVRLAGVKVGSVRSIGLENYAAEVTLDVDEDLPLPDDSFALIRTEGLLGESYVLLRPGGSPDDLVDGGRISETESAVDLIDLVVKYALDSGSEDAPPTDDPLGDPLE
ncbi:MAG: outer membrane lipid asymmetry maintenance protein MlaD [Myxococcota bacterium]